MTLRPDELVQKHRRQLLRTVGMVLLAASLGACSSFDFFKKDDVAPDEIGRAHV